MEYGHGSSEGNERLIGQKRKSEECMRCLIVRNGYANAFGLSENTDSPKALSAFSSLILSLIRLFRTVRIFGLSESICIPVTDIPVCSFSFFVRIYGQSVSVFHSLVRE